MTLLGSQRFQVLVLVAQGLERLPDKGEQRGLVVTLDVLAYPVNGVAVLVQTFLWSLARHGPPSTQVLGLVVLSHQALDYSPALPGLLDS